MAKPNATQSFINHSNMLILSTKIIINVFSFFVSSNYFLQDSDEYKVQNKSIHLFFNWKAFSFDLFDASLLEKNTFDKAGLTDCLPLFLSLRWSTSRTVLMERLLITLPGVTNGSVSGSMFGYPFQGSPGRNSAKQTRHSVIYATMAQRHARPSELLCNILFQCKIWLEHVKHLWSEWDRTWWPVDIGGTMRWFGTAGPAISHRARRTDGSITGIDEVIWTKGWVFKPQARCYSTYSKIISIRHFCTLSRQHIKNIFWWDKIRAAQLWQKYWCLFLSLLNKKLLCV